jgi:GT2 family glycosyltransferase
MPVSPSAAPISVVLVSKGRPEILGEGLKGLRDQTLAPAKIVVVVPTERDLPDNAMRTGVEIIVGPNGLTCQRNAGIRAIAATTPYVAFFDDDFEPRADYLERAVAFLDGDRSVVALSGLEPDDHRTVSRAVARRMIAAHASAENGAGVFIDRGPHFILYGCNMVIRRAILEKEEFDENLPLYAFGEDYEISMRLLRHGRIGRFHGCVGIHLLAPGGRVREVQRAYSQVANNWYFLRKGTVHLPAPWATVRFWSICVGRATLVAGWNVLRGNRAADWRGRLRGNLMAVRDIFTGRCHPRRILEL